MKTTDLTVSITFERSALIDFFQAVNKCYEADRVIDFLSASEQYEIVKFLESTAEICGYKGVTNNGKN